MVLGALLGSLLGVFSGLVFGLLIAWITTYISHSTGRVNDAPPFAAITFLGMGAGTIIGAIFGAIYSNRK